MKHYYSRQKADYNEKIKDIESKYFTTSDYNKFKNDILDPKIKIKILVNKSDISGFINNTDFNEKMKTLATKAELKAKQDKIVKLQTYDLSLFIGQSYFFNDGAQNFLIFQAILNTFTIPTGPSMAI